MPAAASSTTSWITFAVLVVALIIAVVLLMYCMPSKSGAATEEGYDNYMESFAAQQQHAAGAQEQHPSPHHASSLSTVLPSEPLGDNEVPQRIQNQHNTAVTPKDCFPKDQLTPAELLPADANSTWAQVVPAGQGSVGDSNLLTAGYHVGINTVGQTLRNANMQLRSEPPNPQVKVSPWLQSTIEPDTNRKPLEIGGC